MKRVQTFFLRKEKITREEFEALFKDEASDDKTTDSKVSGDKITDDVTFTDSAE